MSRSLRGFLAVDGSRLALLRISVERRLSKLAWRMVLRTVLNLVVSQRNRFLTAVAILGVFRTPIVHSQLVAVAVVAAAVVDRRPRD